MVIVRGVENSVVYDASPFLIRLLRLQVVWSSDRFVLTCSEATVSKSRVNAGVSQVGVFTIRCDIAVAFTDAKLAKNQTLVGAMML